MVGKYSITQVKCLSGNQSSEPRNVTLSVNGHSLDHLSKCTERTTDLRTLDNTVDGRVLNECYIDLSLDKLRELDSDRYAQDQYILSRSKFLDKGLVNVLTIKLRIECGQTLCDDDYDYLNSLLSWSKNDIYVMPVLEFDESVDRLERVSVYDGFVKKMLEDKSSWISDNVNIGMSVPQIYPRRNLGNLFDLYSDENPTFLAVDFNNSRMDRPSDVTGTILKHFKELNEERFFLYGVNVKPYKRGAENTSAWDIYMVHGSFNAIGPTHSKPRAMVLPGDWNNAGRIFDQESIRYQTIDEVHRDSFIEWVSDNYDFELYPDFKKNGKSIYPYLKRYNFQSANNVLGEFTSAIKEGDEDYYHRMLDAIPAEMKGVNIHNRERRKRRSESP